MAVAVILAVGFIMLMFIRDDIVQSESIMSGNEIDRGVRFAATMIENVGRARQTRGDFRQLPLIATPELPHRITIPLVPLGSSQRKAAAFVKAVTLPAEDRHQIEAETIDLHLRFRCPIAQGIGHHLQHAGMA